MEKELELMLEDFIENHSDVEISKIYLKVYNEVGYKGLQKNLAYFHQELNNSFSFMNDKSRSNLHYNADDSRFLLKLIDELRVFIITMSNTKNKISLNQEYIEKIKEAKSFLQSSGGSSIPENYKELSIVKFKPIFIFEKEQDNKNSIEEKIINTEANFNENIISIVLNKDVFSHIKELLNSGHYFNAVEEAYKIVRAKLKEITGEEQAHKGFKEDNYELIFGNKPKDNVEKDFFDGIKYLHMSIQFLRNEKAHTPKKEIDKNLAIHYIVLASLAYDLIDR